jgi:hypothetical protein
LFAVSAAVAHPVGSVGIGSREACGIDGSGLHRLLGQLLVGGNAITDKQLDKLNELQARKDNPEAKPLTANMQTELEELIAKRDGDFEFGSTAMTYIRSVWMRNTYGYDEPLVSNEILKGLMVEDEVIDVMTRQLHEKIFRTKNEDSYENEYFTGNFDVIILEVVEDAKASWTLRTFVETRKPDPLYYAQGQVYMDLTGRKRFRVCHVLVDTPKELIDEEMKRLYFRFNCDEQNPIYQELIKKVDAMHRIAHKIPECDRIKVFEFPFNRDYLDTLKLRVKQARVVYGNMSLRLDF